RLKERKAAAMPRADEAPELWRHLEPHLDHELHRLPDKYRVPIVLCDLEGKSRKEAARQLGCPEGTVASRLARARQLLARRLARYGPSLSVAALTAALANGSASAGVPCALTCGVARAAALVAGGQEVVPGVVSARAIALKEGVLKAMLITKLKI